MIHNIRHNIIHSVTHDIHNIIHKVILNIVHMSIASPKQYIYIYITWNLGKKTSTIYIYCLEFRKQKQALYILLGI